MKIFDFDAAELRSRFDGQGFAHIPGGVTPEFLEAMRDFADRSLGEHLVEGPGIGGKGTKDQAVFEFPEAVDFPSEVFDAISELTGLDRSTLTLSERHVNAYYSDAPTEPTAHKDRHSSQVSVGLTIESPAESRVVLYPSDDRGINPFNVSFALLDSLPDERHPDVLLKDAHEVEIDDQPGDVLAFQGSSMWHLRREPAGATILYLKMNDFGSDPLGEDPRTPGLRQATLAAAAGSDDEVLGRLAVPGRRLDTVSRRYLRDGRDLMEAQVWGEKPMPLTEWELRLVREIDSQPTVHELLARLGRDGDDSGIARVRALAERGIIEISSKPASGRAGTTRD